MASTQQQPKKGRQDRDDLLHDMLRRVVRVVDMLELFRPLGARHHLRRSAEERVVVEVHLWRVDGVDERRGCFAVEALHLRGISLF